MPAGTFVNSFFKANVVHMMNLWRLRTTRVASYVALGGFLTLSAITIPGAKEDHESRIETSNHYKKNYALPLDHPTYALPDTFDRHVKLESH